MTTPKIEVLSKDFILGQAEEAVTTFFAPVRGMYDAIVNSADPTVSNDEREPGRALKRFRRRKERAVQR